MSFRAINAPPLTASQEPPGADFQATRSRTSRLAKRESLWMVHNFLNASVASICYERGLIPSDSQAFQTRRVADLFNSSAPHQVLSYEAFLARNEGLSTDQNSQAFKIFVRRQHPKVDKILALLDALFDALYRGFLQVVQFTLSNSKHRAHFFECYTFSITYVDINGVPSVSQVQMTDGDQDALLVVGARKSFKRAISGVLNLVAGLSDPPRRRSLGMNLFYSDRCPDDYEPQGFISRHGANIPFPNQEARHSGLFDAGYYRVGVTAARPTPPETDQLDDDGGSEGSGDSNATLFIEDLETSKGLQQMQRSSTYHDSQLEPTQTESFQSSATAPRLTPAPAGASTFTASRRQRNLKPSKIAELVIHAIAREHFSAATDGSSPADGGLTSVFDKASLDQKIVKRKDNSKMQVKCECKSNDESSEMLVCELCGTMQHVVCYGFGGVSTRLRPEEHFCYSCILLPRESTLNNEMPRLVRLRLAVTYIKSFDSVPGIRNRQEFDFDFLKHLHLDRSDFNVYQTILHELEARGFIKAIAGKSDFIVVKNMKLATDGGDSYDPLDPVVKIGHHYEPRKDKDNVEIRQRKIQRAVKDYAGNRAYGEAEDMRPAMFDELLVKDSFGNIFPRWGFYPGVKVPDVRPVKRALEVASEPTPKRVRTTERKMSMSKTLINLDSSSDLWVSAQSDMTDGETVTEEEGEEDEGEGEETLLEGDSDSSDSFS